MSAHSYRGRLAPSPTGALHLGNARTFLVAWLRARQAGGALVMRVEDIDGPRVKEGAAEAALGDLAWLGLDWDEGPDVGGPHGPYVQTERAALHAEAIARLQSEGRAYPCVCTRREVEEAMSAPHGPDGPIYPGTCRARFPSLAEAEAAALPDRPPAMRFAVDPARGPIRFDDAFAGPQAYAPADLGDFVIARRTREAAYQIAVVLDDVAMGITEVVRADDLLPSTARQILLYEALGAPPPAFCHLPLVVGPCGRRLAKRHGDTRVATLRDAGVPPERLVGLLARWLGIDRDASGEAMPRDLIEGFDLHRVPRDPVVFDARAVAEALGVRAHVLGAG